MIAVVPSQGKRVAVAHCGARTKWRHAARHEAPWLLDWVGSRSCCGVKLSRMRDQHATQEHIRGYFLGRLDPQAAEELKRHLLECDACALQAAYIECAMERAQKGVSEGSRN
jgi:Putative zinc-finger